MLSPQVIAAIKRTFSRSKFHKTIRDKSVVKGKKGIRGGKIGECSICKAHIPLYKLTVDHINPIVPLMIPAKCMAFVWFYKRTFCDASNLQVICKECHEKKSKKENKQRVQWRRKKKYLVCRSSMGSKIKVLPITYMKEFPEDLEVLAVYDRRKKADSKAKTLRRI